MAIKAWTLIVGVNGYEAGGQQTWGSDNLRQRSTSGPDNIRLNGLLWLGRCRASINVPVALPLNKRRHGDVNFTAFEAVLIRSLSIDGGCLGSASAQYC